MVDFGADESFASASGKLKEHYGIEVPPIAVQRKTYVHGHQMSRSTILREEVPRQGQSDTVVLESDGTMVPLMEIKPGRGDARKRRAVFWKEAISTLAYPQGSTTPVYATTLEGRDEAGFQMLHTALCAGMGENSYLHVVGDGAKWIEEKAQYFFGSRAHYLIDFYHLCDYLAPAVTASGVNHQPVYLGRLKSLCKQGKVDSAIRWLKPFEEPKSVKNQEAPVRAAIRYIENRPGQFDYPRALEKQLPIGSGEIESAHRFLIQKRLKNPGAWWKPQNAQTLLEIRTQRANSLWEEYWQKNKAA